MHRQLKSSQARKGTKNVHGNGTGQHGLHRERGEGLGVGRPSNGHSLGSRDVRNNHGRSNVSRSVTKYRAKSAKASRRGARREDERLDPSVLSEGESIESFSKVLTVEKVVSSKKKGYEK